MRHDPIAFRPTDENKRYLDKLPKGKRSVVINNAIGVQRLEGQPCKIVRSQRFSDAELATAKKEASALCKAFDVPLTTHPRVKA